VTEPRLDRRPRYVEPRFRERIADVVGRLDEPDHALRPEALDVETIAEVDPPSIRERLLDQHLGAAVAQVVSGDDRVPAARARIDHLRDRIVASAAPEADPDVRQLEPQLVAGEVG